MVFLGYTKKGDDVTARSSNKKTSKQNGTQQKRDYLQEEWTALLKLVDELPAM